MIVAVEKLKSRTGAYPRHLQEAGVDDDDRVLIYGLNDRRMPFVAYAVPFMLFDHYDYDFEGREWTYRAD